MKTLRISHPDGNIETTVTLPSSKSISNRALIIQSMQPGIKLHNLSNANDTVLMQQALKSDNKEIYLKNAGTCVRFLTAYFAATSQEKIITGDERMQQRPLHTLIEALSNMGADITCLQNPGYIPLFIKGKQLTGSKLFVNATESSQFTSALLLIAPLLSSDLLIQLSTNPVSAPYIQMTLNIMKYFGVHAVQENNSIVVSGHQMYDPMELNIEPDWSAASYWYEIAALSNSCNIFLTNLSAQSWQGDQVVAQLMETHFGVKSLFEKNGVRLIKTTNEVHPSAKTVNLLHAPDLAPAIAVTAAALQQQVVLDGLQTLSIKETDRLYALATELKKAGYKAEKNQHQLSVFSGIETQSSYPLIFETYADHRMAMAFAPLALKLGTIQVTQPEVVDKSYPDFWNHLKQAGFVLSE